MDIKFAEFSTRLHKDKNASRFCLWPSIRLQSAILNTGETSNSLLFRNFSLQYIWLISPPKPSEDKMSFVQVVFIDIGRRVT